MEALGSDDQSAPPRRKRNSACTRCRLQKVRCGNQEPACSNCVRVGVTCIKPAADTESSRDYIRQLEQRTQWLEGIVRKISPGALSVAEPGTYSPGGIQTTSGEKLSRHQPPRCPTPTPTRDLQYSHLTATSPIISSPAAFSPSQIGPNQPLAHDVGLLSLANSTEPKYLGPSSGVTFARLIFASAPQSQGLPSSLRVPEITNELPIVMPSELGDLPPEDEMRYFVDAYFETWSPLYPFIHEDMFQELVARIQSQPREYSTSSQSPSESMDMAQLFLVIALGAKVLESRLSTSFSSDSYYATAMSHVAKLQLHDSVHGVQVMLLLVLSSFSFINGMNAWFLTSTILASCLDLGLQRKHIDGRFGINIPTNRVKSLRCGIFWSAYSLDRTLCVILGRPLTLRDEGIDVEYPGDWEFGEINRSAIDRHDSEPRAKRVCLPQSPYTPAIYSFRFDRITAEIKLMLYRVAQSPARFPWPTNLSEWQFQVDSACREIFENARQDLKWRGLSTGRGHGLQDRTIRLIELKFHQCLMLIHRPSPAISQPSSSSLVTCFESAAATLRIQSELARFANMTNSWLTAHAVFVSGITLLYCLWTCPDVRKGTNLKIFLQQTESCTKLLSTLGKTWSVAKNAQEKFDHLVQLTKTSWNSNASGIAPENQTQGIENSSHTRATPANIPVEIDGLPEGFWDGLDVDFSAPPNMLMDELGDMGTWFDLDWLGDANFSL